MKQSFANLKLKINTNLKSLKGSVASHHKSQAPISPQAPMMAVISESTSLNYPEISSNHLDSPTVNPTDMSGYHSSSDSVNSPVTPFPVTPSSTPRRSLPKYDLKRMLNERGYHSISKIADTLQGGIFKAKVRSKMDGKARSVAIKVTNKKLYEKSVAVVNGKEIAIKENIIDEIRILRWLTRHHPPSSMTRFVDYFQDSENIFLVMDDGGMDFFKFVSQCHQLIAAKLLSIEEWQNAVRVLFKQMVEFVAWMHTKMSICHLDISLENLLISDVFVMSQRGAQGEQQMYLSHNFQIKFCDFGLATAFDGKDFRCNKYVGKTGYKAPEVYGKKQIFDARAADIWSLGVVFFMMAIGAPPFLRPSTEELGFELIMGGRMAELLESWDRMSYLTPAMFDLLEKLLRPESKRISMKDILSHPWLQ